MVLELPPDLAKVAEEELGETAEVREKCLKELREKVEAIPKEKQPYRMDDDYLLAYLRGTKFRVEVAEKKIKNMAEFMHSFPEWCKDLKAEEFSELYGQGFMRVLSGQDKHGRVISCLLPAKMKEIKDPTIFMRWNVWCMNEVLNDPHMQVNGQVIIENFQDFSLINMIRLQSIPQHIMNKCFKMQSYMPFRMRGIFVVNQPRYMNFLWALVRPFMKRKLRERVHFIGTDVAAFHDFIDPEVLPEEFGGTLQEAPTAWLDERIARDAAAAKQS